MVAMSVFFTISLALATRWLPSALCQELPDSMTLGTDSPADQEVTGFHINHVGLNVRNLTASKEFYGTVLGMRHIITIQYTPSYSLTYMGFAQGGRNGTGFQTGTELLAQKNNVDGQIKLFHFSDSENALPASTKQTNTFANIGLVVPDVQAAQNWFERHGVKIIKRIGETIVPADSPLANATNIGPASTSDAAQRDAVVMGLITTDFENILFLEDPDGRCYESLPSTMVDNGLA
ncbi:hypothetical protein LTR27_001500 [Elasticomyces elasticus]|nr:hypothetical protein LTR27_001500 [Elasticomyces elasticus]